MTRNVAEAAKRILSMSDDEIALFAKRDPDMIRDIARPRAPYPVIELADDWNVMLAPIQPST
jgi:hypothetical protein